MNFKQTNSPSLRISRINVIIFILMNMTFLIGFYFLYNISYTPSISTQLILHNYLKQGKFLQINIFFYKYCNNEYISYIILLFIYNYSNIYKSFVLYSIILISKFISGFLQLIYRNYPLYYSEKINFYYIEKYSYSFPSQNLILSPIFFYVTWKIIMKKISKKKMNQKIILFIFFIIYNLLLPLNQFFLGLISISEIIFSILFSFSIYYLLYYVIKINFSNSNQFFKIIRSKLRIILLILIFIFLCEIVTYNYTFNEEKLIIEELKNQNKTKTISEDLSFSNYSFFTTLPFYSIFFAFLGFKYELQYICLDKYSIWAQYNFDNDEINNDNSFSNDLNDISLIDKISITKETQWNHTEFKISFIRLLCLIYFISMILLPGYFYHFKNNIYMNILIKEFLPWCIISIGGTYGFKILFKKLGLINLTLETMLRETI